jgi:hypothetical protein
VGYCLRVLKSVPIVNDRPSPSGIEKILGAAGPCPQHFPFRRNEMHIPMEGDETNVQLINQFDYATERA